MGTKRTLTGKSEIWLHFTKTDNGGKCKYCFKEVKTSGNTTNLRNHMTRAHSHLYDVSNVGVPSLRKKSKPNDDGTEQMDVRKNS